MVVESGARRVLELLLPQIQQHLSSPTLPTPVIIGVSGLQGSGKSTWASAIVKLLNEEHSINTITVSLDEFYHAHEQLVDLREKNPENKLFRTRGQPGTHDEQLASQFFASIKDSTGDKQAPVRIPVFDKSQYNGEGDRAPADQWPVVESAVQVVVFEGWCVGFQSISDEDVKAKLEVASRSPISLTNTLPIHDIDHLLELNRNLKRYCDTFMGPGWFNCFIHLDTDQLENVYTWRLQQEHALIKARGSGMTDEQVKAFIQGYMPSYELYLDGLRKGLFLEEKDGRGKQVRVLFGKRREILDVKPL